MEEIKVTSRHPRGYKSQPEIVSPVQGIIIEREQQDPRLLNPQQRLVWGLFINPKSKTFGNALQSALAAGYSDSYSVNITTRPWWCEKVRRLNLLHKAEAVLEDMIEMPTDVLEEGIKILKNGKIKRVPFVATSPALVKIKQDTAKFVSERLGKDEGYATRTEHTGAEGGPIQISPEKKAASDEAIKKYLNGTG